MHKLNWENIKKLGAMWIMIAVFTIVIGIVMQFQISEEEHNLSRFSGMLVGFGGGMLIVLLVSWLRHHFSTPEKRKEIQIEQNDERNIQLLRAAYTVAAVVSMVLFVIMGFLFCLMNEYVASWIAIGALYIEALAMAIAYKILEKRM